MCGLLNPPKIVLTKIKNKEMSQKKRCFHKWEDLAIINYPPETSVICNKCGKELIKAEFPKPIKTNKMSPKRLNDK